MLVFRLQKTRLAQCCPRQAQLSWGWRDGLVVRSTYRSSQPHQAAYNRLRLQLQGIQCLWSPWAPASLCTHRHTHNSQVRKSSSGMRGTSRFWQPVSRPSQPLPFPLHSDHQAVSQSQQVTAKRKISAKREFWLYLGSQRVRTGSWAGV